MKSQTKLIFATVLAVSSLAFAGQENRGVGMPIHTGKTLALCQTKTGADVEIIQYPQNVTTALVTVDPNKASMQQKVYHVRQIRPPAGLLGAPMKFAGSGFALSIQVDAAPSPNGRPAAVSAPELGLRNEAARCKVN